MTMYTVYAHLLVAENHLSQTEYAHDHGLKLGSRGVHNPELHLLVICGFWTKSRIDTEQAIDGQVHDPYLWSGLCATKLTSCTCPPSTCTFTAKMSSTKSVAASTIPKGES